MSENAFVRVRNVAVALGVTDRNLGVKATTAYERRDEDKPNIVHFPLSGVQDTKTRSNLLQR